MDMGTLPAQNQTAKIAEDVKQTTQEVGNVGKQSLENLAGFVETYKTELIVVGVGLFLFFGLKK